MSIDLAQTEDLLKDYIEKPIHFSNIKIFEEDHSAINRVITLGGDGTILFAIKMFYNKKVPPIISFGMGSVGYL
jgi:NAD kinase